MVIKNIFSTHSLTKIYYLFGNILPSLFCFSLSKYQNLESERARYKTSLNRVMERDIIAHQQRSLYITATLEKRICRPLVKVQQPSEGSCCSFLVYLLHQNAEQFLSIYCHTRTENN